ncbi:MAG: helix-turn-helix domain-containing protein [Candidatus Hydrogenedentes bacterium]|nr:helix-turn-helix domain-containing protein [Candidatus Hydrogenedentota bacterium]
MANLELILKEEIRRLARKEVKAAVGEIQKENRDLKKAVRGLKQQVDALERKSRKVIRHVDAQREVEMKATPEQAERARISADSVRKLRQKLGLTQADFALLLGVSGQSVYQWERKDGKLQLRNATKKAIIEARKMGVREARRAIERGGAAAG